MTDYKTKCLQVLERAKTLLFETDWTPQSNNNDILLESKNFPEVCPVACFRATTLVDKSIDYLMDQLVNETEESRKLEDPDIVSWNLVESSNHSDLSTLKPNGYRVCTQINKMQWPLWSRETVYAQMKVIEDDASWFVNFSVNHESVPLQENQYVRAIIYLSVYKFSKEGDKTRVHRISHIDPSGNIPSSVVTLYSGKLTQPLEQWKK